jgi:hypothetical protein
MDRRLLGNSHIDLEITCEKAYELKCKIRLCAYTKLDL